MAKDSSPRFPDYEWYCIKCRENLNWQSGFDDNKRVWKCTHCGTKNSISKDNLRKPFAILKDPTPGRTFLSFVQGIVRSIYGLISRTALYCFIAALIVVGTNKTTLDHLSLGLINPIYKEDFFCAALYLSGAVFICALLIYALVKRFVGRPDSKKHFIGETLRFLRDNIFYPIDKIRSLFKKTNAVDTIMSVISILIFLLTIALLVYGCTFYI